MYKGGAAAQGHRPRKVYRKDTPDATHFPIFHQIEGLVVDEGVSWPT